MSGSERTIADLIALAALNDDAIDTSDIPETTDFSGARRAAFDYLQRKDLDVRAIANWFLAQARERNIRPTKVWVNKMVFLAYEKALREFKILLTPARAEAWNFGPVFREVYFQYSDVQKAGHFLKYSLEGRKRVEATEEFSQGDLEIFESTWNQYAGLSASRLSELTHQEGSPWDLVWRLGGQENPGMSIDPAIIIGRFDGQRDGKPRNQD